MQKLDQLFKAKALLNQALMAAANSLPNNQEVNEARQHIRRAMDKLDHATKSQLKRKEMNQGQFEQWWGHVQSGVASANHAAMSPQSSVRALEQLNSMIADEQKKLAELEQQATQQTTEMDLLSD